MSSYALSTWLYLNKTLEAALKDFTGAGFSKVEVWANNAHLDPRFNPDFEAVFSLIKKLHIKVHSVHAPFRGLTIGSKDRDDVKNSEKWILKTLEYAAKLDARVMVVHPLSFNFETGSGTSVEYTQELFSGIVNKAESFGVTIAVENLPIAPPAYTSMKGLAELFPDPKLGFCLDIGHSQLNHLNIAEEIEFAGSRLVSCHICNNDGISDLHSLPELGVIDVNTILDKLESLPNVVPVFEVNGRECPEKILDSLKSFCQTRLTRKSNKK